MAVILEFQRKSHTRKKLDTIQNTGTQVTESQAESWITVPDTTQSVATAIKNSKHSGQTSVSTVYLLQPTKRWKTQTVGLCTAWKISLNHQDTSDPLSKPSGHNLTYYSVVTEHGNRSGNRCDDEQAWPTLFHEPARETRQITQLK